jgi:hypothetical protein
MTQRRNIGDKLKNGVAMPIVTQNKLSHEKIHLLTHKIKKYEIRRFCNC